MELSIPRELLLNNYLGKDTQKLFYLFYLLQHMFLSIKFKIRNNFIYPNGSKLNIAMSTFWMVLFICYIYRVFTRYGGVLGTRHFFKSETHFFLVYFYFVYNSFAIVAVFILNVMHTHNNVLLVLNIQTIHEHIQIEKKCHKFNIMWNWISFLSIIFVDVLVLALFFVLYFDYADIIVDYLFIIFDLNFIYAIRIITLLKTYLINFKNKYLVTNSTQNCEDILKLYKIFMQAYTLFDKIFNFMVILSVIIAYSSSFLFGV